MRLPKISDLAHFEAVTMHIFTDGSFFAAKDDDDAPAASAWALAVVLEDIHGNHAFGSYITDMVHLGSSHDEFSNFIGIIDHPALASEYVAALVSVLYALQHPSMLQVVIHSDCLAIVDHLNMQAGLAWEHAGLLQALAALLGQLKRTDFKHSKGHDWQHWNELVDVIATATASGRQSHAVSRPFPSGLLHQPLLLNWLWLAACNPRDSTAWPHFASDGLVVTKYDHAAANLYPLDAAATIATVDAAISFRVCSANILTSDDQIAKDDFVEDRTSRMGFLLGQAFSSGIFRRGRAGEY